MTHGYTVRSRTERFKGNVFRVLTDEVVMPGGQVAERDYVVHIGAVGVVALDDEGRVVLVRQYRHAVGQEPGFSNEVIRLFLARDLRDVPHERRHEREYEEATMTVRRVPLDEAVAMAFRGEITNAACLIGLLAATRARDTGWTSPRPVDAPLPRRDLAPVVAG